LSSIFGNITSETQEEILNGLQKSKVRVWECKKMKIKFSLSYQGIKCYGLTFTDKDLDKENKLLKLNN